MSGVVATVAVALGVLAVVLGVAVFVVDSMARATFALLGSFLAIAVIMLVLDQPYLALVTALMMTMEMAVMAVFMVMFMMNPAGLMPMTMVHNARGSVIAGVGVFAVLAAGVWLVDWPAAPASRPGDATVQLGEALMGDYMLVMIVVGVGLFATIVSGTMLATGRGRYDRLGPDLRGRPPADPVPGGLPR